jgi:cyclophilin family peptidyl-prolyl cis-trans isomerase
LKTLTIALAFVLIITACVSGPVLDTESPEPTLDQSPSGQPTSETEPLQWDDPPALMLDQSKIYLATLETEKGDIQIELFADRAPITVNNFIFLAEQGYYDDTTFHRVLPDFMVQGGDPTGTGGGGPGYHFEDEIDFDLLFDGAGYFAMANGGPGTNGSQFFITYGPTLHLNGNHTIFGKVVEGMDVALSLTLRNPNDQPPPQFEGDKLVQVTIEEIAESLLPAPIPTQFPDQPEIEDGRPLATLPIDQRESLYTGKPEMIIDPGRSYQAVVTTTQGEFVIQLDPIVAPESVNNFVVLAELGFYDGFPISFVNPGELALFGSPGGNPQSDVGYGIPIEFGLERVRGSVGFWFRQELLRLSGSQIYILMTDMPGMNRYFTVFAEVVQGMDVVELLTVEDTIELITISSE